MTVPSKKEVKQARLGKQVLKRSRVMPALILYYLSPPRVENAP